MNEKRIQELMAGMKSCSKETYYKSEVLDELLALQSEMVCLTFNGEHASGADLRIYDVERHLKRLNREIGRKADEYLEQFIAESRQFCDLIKSEISGRAGENRAFQAMESIRTRNIILRNIELRDESGRTELDAIVITPFGINIVEVKNQAKSAFIDDKGDMYRTGKYLRFDCIIKAKMDQKERLLKAVLQKAGYECRAFHKLVVFTNNRIEVQNKCEVLKTCFISQLPYLIDGYSRGDYLYGPEDMENIKKTIENAECREKYSLGFDTNKYKMNFAKTMAIIEAENTALTAGEKAPETGEMAVENISVIESEKPVESVRTRNSHAVRYVKYAGVAAALTAVSVLSGIIVARFGRK